jgi:exonuclease III
MILLSWNCRGLGNPRAIRDLCLLVKEKRPDILFLMETKCFQTKMERIRIKLGMPGMFLVDPVGKSGGLAMMWRDVDDVTIENYSRRHINAMIYSQTAKQTWKLTGFYGHPNPARRHEAWSLLKYLRNHPPGPWLCVTPPAR